MPNLADLQMDHLSTDDMVKEVRATVSLEAVQSPAADARDKEEWPFHFDWTDARGKRWQGDFVNKILDFGDIQQVAVLRSRFSGGQPLTAFADSINILNQAVAHMTFSLKTRPDWAKDLRKLNDMSLVMALWEKVNDHESFYFRLGATEEKSSPTG